ncbi:polyketide cyclase [Kribbella antibiotica]|uniref:Polyketide cyclase n=1 Tax=Kribbella antibiotica TaxID=190195 RepID=A0A4R4ZRG5_9ACTN|nr:SRPBCC family protein [Kribbella antibiotica]TDD61608.1 polyketide cyclase [Kribbella antibiotica]
MVTIQRVLTVGRPVETVFGYLADFEKTNEWDPGTVRTTRLDGGGGVGTTYRNISRFNGRETELVYTVVELSAPERLRFRGVNKTVTASDTITLRAVGPGETELTYLAEFEFRGVARLAVPFLGRQFAKLGDEAAQRLREVLGNL